MIRRSALASGSPQEPPPGNAPDADIGRFDGSRRTRSVVTAGFGGHDVLRIVEEPAAPPGPHEVRIRVSGATVNPIDLSTRSGRLAEAGLMVPTDRTGLGWDVAGHVDAVGRQVRSFSRGDAVVGLRDLLFAAGTHADSVLLDESVLASAPRTWSLVEAATLPLNGLTAAGALAASGARAGDVVLVTGAAGGVGGFALELARHQGVRTVAVGRPDDAELLERLGAWRVLTSSENVGPVVRRLVRGGVDAVIDAAVLGVAAHDALRSRGTFVALVRPFAPPPIRATRVIVHEVAADGRALAELVRLADAGVLTPRVSEVVPLEHAARAHALLEQGGLRGRVVLTP
ncbi:NADP-dependent oxidoreductase [Geodermatophilus sabuli]|uniref:NADPH:quinone reductase n=1 Tax=Geodermatophilus sabuli TaxID=1564158 RepID=A0A285EHS9_9ACTN|nr:NADP-dependent oxidoreductase [Geodermatophilus sabuli]MBB3084045.1 NADPH:quinone reductase-like Zn-dependent oxidoreductase [Geodermatophilus sabuli]SNX98692.1 NADPH:quinone reductase [Geodermatophilus sabuli]